MSNIFPTITLQNWSEFSTSKLNKVYQCFGRHVKREPERSKITEEACNVSVTEFCQRFTTQVAFPRLDFSIMAHKNEILEHRFIPKQRWHVAVLLAYHCGPFIWYDVKDCVCIFRFNHEWWGWLQWHWQWGKLLPGYARCCATFSDYLISSYHSWVVLSALCRVRFDVRLVPAGRRRRWSGSGERIRGLVFWI